jgi:hypothetical protein
VKRRHEFDAILLETTGLADPAPIVYTIQTNPKMSVNYRIDSIVCLADAKHVNLHLDEVKPEGSINEALQQVAFANKILLNKVDLVTEEEKNALKELLAKINKFAMSRSWKQNAVVHHWTKFWVSTVSIWNPFWITILPFLNLKRKMIPNIIWNWCSPLECSSRAIFMRSGSTCVRACL